LLELLQLVGDYSDYIMVTRDESWFYLFYSHDDVYPRPGEEPPARPKRILEDRKVMVTIGFRIAKFHGMFTLPKGQKFNAMYFTEVILPRVLDSGLKAGGHQPIIHADSSRSHTAETVENVFEKYQLQRTPHPHCLQDSAPCHFYLFGHIELRRMGCRFS
jgi:hypothetical protein